jgi:peroxiredoxin
MTQTMEAAVPGVKPDKRVLLPLKVKLAIIGLLAFTVFITWRARILEVELERQIRQPALVNNQAPEFSLATLDGGRTVSLGDFRGQKKVVVTFWASWCGPCRMEMPALVDFYKRNHNESSDFEILAVSIDESAKEATAFAKAQQLNFPVLLDSGQKMAQAYQVEGIPTMFVIDKDGKITYGHIGYEMGMPYWLAHELGIKVNKSREGAADGNAGH